MSPTDFGIENSNKIKYEEFDFFYHRKGGGVVICSISVALVFFFLEASEVPIVLKINNNAI